MKVFEIDKIFTWWFFSICFFSLRSDTFGYGIKNKLWRPFSHRRMVWTEWNKRQRNRIGYNSSAERGISSTRGIGCVDAENHQTNIIECLDKSKYFSFIPRILLYFEFTVFLMKLKQIKVGKKLFVTSKILYGTFAWFAALLLISSLIFREYI